MVDIQTLDGSIGRNVRLDPEEDRQVKDLYRRWIWTTDPKSALERGIARPTIDTFFKEENGE
jgi:hypothetical protein